MQPEGTHTRIVFAVVSHKISTPVVSHKVSTPALAVPDCDVPYFYCILCQSSTLPSAENEVHTHGRLPRRSSPGQLTATEMTTRPLKNALAQWLPAPAVISARLGAGRLQLVCQDWRRRNAACAGGGALSAAARSNKPYILSILSYMHVKNCSEDLQNTHKSAAGLGTPRRVFF